MGDEQDMVDRIQAVLSDIQNETGARILLAVESGSRAWGFPSPDSDWDVRFIYAMPTEHYLQVRDRRDVIERMSEDRMLDLSGWDVRKTINLLLKSNATAIEWLCSPVVYRQMPSKVQLLRSFGARASVGGMQRHYFHLARSLWREHFTRSVGDNINLKKYFYVLRPCLALRFIRETGLPPPMDLQALLGGTELTNATRRLIRELVAVKRETRELGEGARIHDLDLLCMAELAAAEATLGRDPPITEARYAEADLLFRQLIDYTAT